MPLAGVFLLAHPRNDPSAGEIQQQEIKFFIMNALCQGRGYVTRQDARETRAAQSLDI